jgi:hypothetical protein
MIKHFENLWEEAENVIWKAHQEEEIDAVDLIQCRARKFWAFDDEAYQAMLEQAMGELLLYACLLSKKHNINTYAVLKEAMNDMKVEILDPDIDSDF